MFGTGFVVYFFVFLSMFAIEMRKREMAAFNCILPSFVLLLCYNVTTLWCHGLVCCLFFVGFAGHNRYIY